MEADSGNGYAPGWGMLLMMMNIALMIHIERAHANFVLENEMERIIGIFGSGTGRDSYLF